MQFRKRVLGAAASSEGIQRPSSHHDRRDDGAGQLNLTPSEKTGNRDDFANLNELAAPPPVENPDEQHYHSQDFLEERCTQGRDLQQAAEPEHDSRPPGRLNEGSESASTNSTVTLPPRTWGTRIAGELYIVSYLTLFSILGTLARLGLEALTTYEGAPVTTSGVWPNFAGSIIIGFLSEDMKLFQKHGYAHAQGHESGSKRRDDSRGGTGTDGVESQDASNEQVDLVPSEIEANKAHAAFKKTIPLYIGLATGFCGSFTSFSTFMRDVFLALSNDASQSSNTGPRSGGYSLEALLAVILLTLCLCISGLFAGAHIAIAAEQILPTLPPIFTRDIFHRATCFLAWCAWAGAVCLAIWPPDRPGGPAGSATTTWGQETWRGQVVFALVFAPIGCITRFYVSILMNGLLVSFPLGTFCVNVFGTAILGMAWDLQHTSSLGPLGGPGRVGCQVLQGVQDGYCGCLTTISTWVLELTTLRRKHAYIYGMMSIGVALAFLVIIMGTLQWSQGFAPLNCSP